MTSTEWEPWITEPGIYYDVDHQDYLADPVVGGSLSASGIKLLLPPSCPAKYRWRADHGSPDKPAFSFGRAAHRRILGAGEEIVVVDADSWRTKDAKQARADAQAAGATAILVADWAVIADMEAALRAHPTAAALLDPDSGRPEVVIVWADPATGIMHRSKLDWLRHHQPGRRLVVPDYKTCDLAEPEAFGRAAYNYDYETAAALYLEGVQAVTGAPDPAFVHIAQEKTPPYVVSVFELDHIALAIGRARVAWGRQVYQHCAEHDTWPGYVPDHEPNLLALPPWAEIREGVTR